VHYQFNAVKTIKTSFQGTLNMLGLAKRTKARFLLTSTSGNFFLFHIAITPSPKELLKTLSHTCRRCRYRLPPTLTPHVFVLICD